LNVDAALDRWNYSERGGRVPKPKLVHNIVLSMPRGTPPNRLFAASREFAREEFGMQHRYAFVLHTDQDHPHVHLVISAHRLDGDRLNIRKTDLRRWREQFARQLRRQGIEANATPVQTRGKLTDHQRDGVYRPAQRGASWVESERRDQARAAAAGHEANGGHSTSGAALGRIFQTAEAVQGDWLATVGDLDRQGEWGLATAAEQFRQSLRVPRTRLERAVGALRRSSEVRSQREAEPVR
jgi:Relaxase/Mobilisation nuclease domain